ncbi:hypothetical protein CC86DRAFT_290245 [Ophiobolus disseminans]|uniref:HTH CENPB-type domain-containing protein n=1 Tax=Ophiobolus disseminans TaxID=1469910 RepID=A0A6A7A4H5_9PLEO|nr:hypothetical protein CC86DRAFT_290245 [Ophiobolus disseminans]
MDRASRVLSQGLPPGVPASYRVLADHSNGKAQSQQYLRSWEEDAPVRFLLQMADLDQPVRVKFVPSLAFCIARHRAEATRPSKPPGKNWARAFEKRHPNMHARRVKALDWNRHERSIYWKMSHWFDVIGELLQDPSIRAENVYGMNKTGVMLSILGSVKVLMGKNDTRKYRGARVSA